MTDLSADKKTEYKQGLEIAIPVATGSKIYAGANVCVNSSGYAVKGGDTSGLHYAGVSREYVDNSAGADGALTVLIARRGLYKMEFATAISQANIGYSVFLKDDNLVDVAGNVDNNIYCGIIVDYIDSTHAWVDIEPAIKEWDLTAHIEDTTAAHAASAISIADAGSHFAATENTVEAAIQKLAKTIVITIPRFTGWTKDGTDKTIALPALEMPVPVVVKRAYVNLGTAPSSGKTLTLKLNTSTLAAIADTATQGEAESLSIAIAKDTDFAITANETSDGQGANCDIILVAQVDDGE